ncbi:hypothetical protein ACFWQC_02075 [Nocardioides sp. NPDC058538]|uniref:hypothetical protein n=1 Tax=Nocardioides sp. NPDC058538 TaxID=3346542 RepID=UPI0036581738
MTNDKLSSGAAALWTDWFVFGEPFERLTDATAAAALEDELKRELAPEHPFHGHDWTAVARACDQDEVIVHDGQVVALVHLTWSRKREDPPSPTTSVISSAEEFRELLKYR